MAPFLNRPPSLVRVCRDYRGDVFMLLLPRGLTACVLFTPYTGVGNVVETSTSRRQKDQTLHSQVNLY